MADVVTPGPGKPGRLGRPGRKATPSSPESATGKERGGRLTTTIVMLLLSVLFLAPALGVLWTSLKSNTDIAANGLWAPTGDLTTDNYLQAWRSGNAGTYLLNSVLVSIPAAVISIVLGSLVGYTVAKLRPRGSQLITLFFVAGLFVPPQILLLPLFKLFSASGLYDTLWPMIIVHSGYGMSLCTLVMRNFFQNVPDSLREAGLVDGASEPRILLSLAMPLARPALATLATLQFTFIWNDFLYPLVFTSSEETRTVMVGILSLQGRFSVAYGTQAAMAVLASLPTLLVYIVFQKHFVRGLTAGAVKG
ncbi:carbohydrate ABC transporter permease [Streptomyces sp. AJS327]|uniref:carbohydrate ABC transporter permease n=1 Tax=Streptomyces sp. AJS327 TaxID=2545265 RepID=UPI0015E029F1|nr:carbohydrate ABC transporter permease [Streptomyces sp. AJS327]MBA0051272.1 carbohydrate ABC transporter permease [Streptomyces sp. AJS327]